MLGVFAANSLAILGSVANRYRLWAFDLNGIIILLDKFLLEFKAKGGLTIFNMPNWDDHQDFEASFWGDCVNTFCEEQKQYVYAKHMGLSLVRTEPKAYGLDLAGKSVLDIGGGPVSLLLRCINLGRCAVVDPCRYPAWTKMRYDCLNIDFWRMAGEDLGNLHRADEVWIYNVLQHTQDPAKIIENAKAIAPVLRIFEWVDFPPHLGHPHELTKAGLESWIGQPGTVTAFTGENHCYGKAFHGCFTHARNHS